MEIISQASRSLLAASLAHTATMMTEAMSSSEATGTSMRPHGITSQKMVFLVAAAMKMSRNKII
jgi:hypothetical protein